MRRLIASITMAMLIAAMATGTAYADAYSGGAGAGDDYADSASAQLNTLTGATTVTSLIRAGGTISAISRASNTVTVTLSAAYANSNLKAGQGIVISGVQGFNGKFTIAAVASQTSFTYSETGSDATGITSATSAAGGHYTTLTTWEAARQGDITAAGRNTIEVAECYNDWASGRTENLTITGWTTDSTHYIDINAPSSERHEGTWSTAKFRIVPTTGVPLTNGENYVRIYGLQLYSADDSAYVSTAAANGDERVYQNIIKGNAQASKMGITTATATTIKIYNNVIYDVTGTSGYGIYINNASAIASIYNNTLIDNTAGIGVNAGTATAKNNIVKGSGSTNAYVGTFAAGTDYNATDGTDAIGQGSNNRISQTFTFFDEVNNDFHLDASDAGAKDYGVSDPSGASLFTTDIDGTTRGQWDIGADEGAKEFTSTIKNTGGDFNTLSGWEDVVDNGTPNLTANATRVFSGAVTGAIGDNVTVTLYRGGVNQSVTASAVKDTATQIFLRAISDMTFAFAANDQWRVDASNYFTISDKGNPVVLGAACYNDFGSGGLVDAVSISGFTTGPYNYIKVYTPASERHSGTASTGFKLSSTGTTGISIQEEYVRVDGLVINANESVDGATTAQYGLGSTNISSPGDIRISNCIVYNAALAFYNFTFVKTLIYNCIAYDLGNYQGTTGGAAGNSSDTDLCTIYNSTFLKTATDANNSNAGLRWIKAVNCAVFHFGGTSGSDYLAIDAGSSNNASHDTSGSAGLQSLVATNQFTSITTGSEDLRLKTGSALIGAGTNLTSDATLAFTTDIDANARPSTGTWCVGADEYMTFTWEGDVSTAWETAGNWVGGAVPTSTSDVTISTKITYEPTINSATTIKSLTLGTGRTLTCSANLTVTGNVDLDGALDIGSNIFTVAGNLDIATGATFTNSSGTVVLNSTDAANLISGGKTITTLKVEGVGPHSIKTNSLTATTLKVGETTTGVLSFTQGETLTLTATDITVYATGTITCPYTSLTVPDSGGSGRTIIATNINIISGGSLNADGLGFAGSSTDSNGSGPGAGKYAYPSMSGAGYGGSGGFTDLVAGGSPYGTASSPVALGSGGSKGSADGGGAVKLSVSGTLTVNGTLSANGENAASHGSGGSGGSIWISGGLLKGTGTISATGGSGYSGSGFRSAGGGGGRIDISSATVSGSTFLSGGGAINVGGGSEGAYTATIQHGSAGTIKFPASFDLVIDNSGATGLKNLTLGVNVESGAVDETLYNFNSVTVKANSTLTLSGDPQIENTANGGSAGDKYGQGVTLTATNIDVQANGTISANSQGFTCKGGPGKGNSSSPNASGGGYGNVGGSAGGIAGGSAYGISTAPTALGSGAGGGALNYGGGAVKLSVSGTLTVNGILSANGNNTSAGGGGSGGSAYLVVDILAGTGTISANGANGNGSSGWQSGGGGGGRAAVYYTTSYSITPTATAGAGVNTGAAGDAGTVHIEKKTGAFTWDGSESTDWHNRFNWAGNVVPGTSADVTIPTAGVTNNPTISYQAVTIGSLAIQSGGSRVLTCSANLTVTGNVTCAGTLTLGTTTLTVGGNLDLTSGTLTSSAYTIKLNSADAANIISGGLTINTLSVEGVGPHSIKTNSLTVTTLKVGETTTGVLSFTQNETLTLTATDITVYATGTITCPYTSLTVPDSGGSGRTIIATNINIISGGSLNADGKGFVQLAGPGAPVALGNNDGASYGGWGGDSDNAGGVRSTYGSITNPTSLGSGGDESLDGGGAIIISATGTVTINGTLSANGTGGSNDGAGSGGSINITAGTLAGSGTITANGGSVTNPGGGGGGGRISLNGVTTDNFIGTLQANGGSTYARGYAGTIYLNSTKRNSLTLGGAGNLASLRLGTDDTATAYTFGTITIQSGGTLEIDSNLFLNSSQGTSATLSVTTLDIQTGGVLKADGLGFSANAGPGTPTGSYDGGSYGGIGGDYGGDGISSSTYGSMTNPTSLGSGGANYGIGGGAIIISASGTVTVNGTLSADGAVGTWAAGSGGSINITANTLAGSGTIKANGGSHSSRGSGGGGRAAIYYTTSYSITPTATGGTGGVAGTAGTVYIQKATGAFTWDGSESTDWHNRFNWAGNVVPGVSADVTIPTSGVTNNPTISYQAVTIASLTVQTGRVLTTSANLTVTGNVTCAGTLKLNATTFTVGGNLDFTGGTLTEDTSTIVMNASSGTKTLTPPTDLDVYNLTISGAGTFAVGTTSLDVNGSFTQSAGTLTAPSSTMYVATSIGTTSTIFSVASGATFNHNNGTVEFRGATVGGGTLTIDVPTSLTLYNVNILGDASYTYTTAAGDTVIAANNFTHTDGVLSGTWQVQGALTSASTADGGTGAIALTGAGAQAITLNGGSFPTGAFTVNKASGTAASSGAWTLAGAVTIQEGTLALGGATTFNGGVTVEAGGELACTTAGTTITIDDADTVAVQAGGMLRLEGASGNLVTLASDTTAQWDLTMNGAYYINYVQVSYSTAATGQTIYAQNSQETTGYSGTNTNWNFSATGATITWNGSASIDWLTPANWDLNRIPMYLDSVVVPAAASYTSAPTIPAGTYSYNSLTINSTAVVTAAGDAGAVNAASGGTTAIPHGEGVTINLATASVTGTLKADEQGFAANTGPGKPPIVDYGGSYGGRGGGDRQLPYYLTYGSSTQPTALGSGGGGSSGIGGGAIKLSVTGIVTINGTVSAKGKSVGSDVGGGSGGSIWIIADTLAGSGTIQADGGSAGYSAYGGGGGRVRLAWTTKTFNGVIKNAGGTGSSGNGRAGTYSFPDNNNLTVNYNIALAAGSYNIPTLTVTNNATLECQGDPTAINAASGGTESIPHGIGVTITTTNVTVDNGAKISADELGFPSGSTTAGPGYGANQYCGGGYGGRGGNDGGGNNRGSTYGSPTQPTALGSSFLDSANYKSVGGGAIKLSATGTVTINGTISANGRNGESYLAGTSGGSIWVIANTLTGAGIVQANGGINRGGYSTYGGGGGRIAIERGSDTSSLSVTAASGLSKYGTAASNGTPGTISWSSIGGYTADNVIPTAQAAQSTTGNGVVTVSFKVREPGDLINTYIYQTGDTQVYDGGNGWAASSGQAGIQTKLYFNDANSDGVYTSGEDIWYDSVTVDSYYNTGETQVYDGGNGWGTANATAGIIGNLAYYDADSGSDYDTGEDIWADIVGLNNNHTLESFQYSVNGGAGFNAPTNGDTSASLGGGWPNNSAANYTGASTFAGASAQSFTWNTKHADLTGLDGAEQSDIQIKFKVKDKLTQSAVDYYVSSSNFATSQDFIVDNKAPVWTAPAFAVSSIGSTQVTLTWNAATESNFNHYEIWYDTTAGITRVSPELEWDNINDANLATVSTTTTTITGLTAGLTYYFKIWAVDNYGYETTTTEVSALTNNPPFGGYTADNTIPAAQCAQATDGTGTITINFKLRDPDGGTPVSCTLNTFRYSDDGNNWYAPTNGGSSAAFSANWSNNSYTAGTAWTGPYSFSFNTKHADVTSSHSLDDVDQSDVQIRFKVNDGISDSVAYATSDAFTLDNLDPTLSSDAYANSTKDLVLTFDDNIDTSVTTSSSFTLADDPTAGNSFTLTETPSGSDGTTLTFTLTDAHRDTIAGWNASGKTTLYLAIASSGAKDMSGNGIAAVSRQAVDTWTKDTTAPTLSSDAYANSTKELVLTFNENIDTSAATSSSFTLADDPTAGNSFTLTETAAGSDGTTLTFTLTDAHRDTIAGWNAGGKTTLYLAIASSGAKDMSGNGIAAVSRQAVDTWTKDTTAPTLSSDAYANSTKELVLTFNENIDTSAATSSSFTLADDPTAGNSFTLTETAAGSDGTTLTFTLTDAHRDTIAGWNASGKTTLYLAIASSGAKDMSGNGIAAVSRQAIDTWTKDTTAPTLSATAGDHTYTYSTKVLVLTFSENVDVSTVDRTKITLADAATAGNTLVLTTGDTLTDGTDDTTLSLTLTNAHRDTIATWDGGGASNLYVEIALAGIKDMSGNSIVAMGSRQQIGNWNRDETAPTLNTVSAVSVNDAGDTITLTFSEAMAVSTVSDGCPTLVIKYADNGSGGNAVTLNTANSTVSWTGNTEVTITLNETSDVAYIPNGKYAGVTPNANSVKDLSGNAAANTAVYTASGVTGETTVPTVSVSASSVHPGGDTITLTFSEPMNTSNITNAILQANTNVTLDFSDNAGNTNQIDIAVANATVSWSNIETATITLNEGTDSAYIPNGKYIGVTFDTNVVKDLAGNGVVSNEYYTSAGISKETTAPAITAAAQYNASADDTVTITSNEVFTSAAGTLTNWTVYYDDNQSVGDETLIITTHANASLDATKKVVTITLNETTDGAYLPNGKYIKVAPNPDNPNNIKDLVGNYGVAAAWTATTVGGDTTPPTFTAAAQSVHSGGDTITLTFNEVMDTTTLTDANLASNVELDHSDNAGGLSQADIVIANATVSWDSTKKIATITLNEETDNAYIPNNKFIGVTAVTGAIKDLAGNAVVIPEVYTASGISKEGTAPTITSTLPSASSSVKNTKVSYTLSETVASGKITWTVTSGADAGSPHEQSLAGVELHEGPHSDITNNPALVDGAVYTVKFEATDWVGNAATTVENTSVKYDVTNPSIISVSVASNNSLDTTRAKAGDDVTYSITYSEAVTVSVGSASTANNASTLKSEVSTASASIVFTVASGNNGAITPNNINFTITDAAGNYRAITSLGAITGSVTADTTLPTVTIGVSANPTATQAIDGLIFTLTFSESMSTGTAPTVTYDPAGSTTGAQPATGGTWSVNNTVYTVANDNAITPTTGDGVAAISVSGAKDLAGNVMTADTNDTFQIITTVLWVTGISDPITAGAASSVIVTAKDTEGAVRADYAGTIAFSSSDSNRTLPSNYTFVPATDNGAHTFTNGVTLKTKGEQSVTATDTSQSVITGSQTAITVNPGLTSYYTLTTPADIVAGNRAAYVVKRYDEYNNLQTIGAEFVYLTTTNTSPSALFKDDATAGATITSVTLADGSNFANFWYYDQLVGSWTVTASDAATPNGTAGVDDATDGINVTQAAVSKFKVTSGSASTASMNAGDSIAITIKAYDQYNNVATAYGGASPGVDKTIVFSGANTSALNNAPTCKNNVNNNIPFGSGTILTFTNGVAGSTMFLYKAEGAAIKAMDLAPAPDIETSATEDLDVTVLGGDASTLSWGTKPATKAIAHAPWKAFTVNVTDAYGNVASTSPTVTVTPTGAAYSTQACTYQVTAISGVATFDNFAVYNSNDDTASGYPIIVNINASSGLLAAAGLLADTERVTVSKTYAVTLNAKDSLTGGALTGVTLTILDAGTGNPYSYAGLTNPQTGNSPFVIQLPYDTYQFNFVKDAYVDKTEEKTANVGADSADNIYDNNITWTVYLTSLAEATADYQVKSSFVYDEDTQDLTIRLWLERRGVLILSTAINKLGPATVRAYNETAGAWFDLITLTAPAVDATTGTYVYTATDVTDTVNVNDDFGAALTAGKTYYAKCKISYGGATGTGATYETGTTFTITISVALSREIITKIGLPTGQTIAGKIAEVKSDTTTIKTDVGTIKTDVGTIKTDVATVKSDVAAVKGYVDTEVAAILEDTGTTIPAAVTDTAKRGVLSQILNRDTRITKGSTVTIRYRTASGLASTTTLTIYDEDNAIVSAYNAKAMTEISTTGIYEYDVKAESTWDAGDYTVVCAESTQNAKDSMVLTVKALFVAGEGVEAAVDSIGDMTSTIYTLMGTTEDISSSSTVFGMVNDLNTTIDNLDLATVGTDARNAKSNAIKAYQEVNTLKSDVTDIQTKVDSLQKLVAYVEDMKHDLLNISNRMKEQPPAGIVTTAEIAQVAAAAAAAKMAETPSLRGAEGAEAIPVEEVVTVTPEREEMVALQNKVEELSALANILTKLIETTTNQPVVEGWFEVE